MGNQSCFIASQWIEIFQWNLVQKIGFLMDQMWLVVWAKLMGKKISYSYYPPVFCELPGPITDRFTNLGGPIHKSPHGACFYYNSTIRNFMENSLEWSNVRGFVKPVPFHCHWWEQDPSMKFHGKLINWMFMMWFGSTQKVMGKIFSYCGIIGIGK